MIVDAFIFFNEIDLLKIRIETLKTIVDKFVIVEASKTFSGKDKPIYFDLFEKEFLEYKDKIVRYIVTDMPTLSTDTEHERFKLEIFQRNSIKRALYSMHLDDNDIVLLSDVDEIPTLNSIQNAANILTDYEVAIFVQRGYRFYLNYTDPTDKFNRKTWLGTVAFKYITANQYEMEDLRSRRKRDDVRQLKNAILKSERLIWDAGWHFTWLGGNKSYFYKAQSFSHLNKSAELVENVAFDVCRNNDHNSRKFRQEFRGAEPIHDELFIESFDIARELPHFLIENKLNYTHFFYFTKPFLD